jgi:hypothetical protein
LGTWWIVLQTLVLGSGVLAVVVFVALFVALKHVDKSRAAFGATVAVVSQILFVAYYPVLLGLVYLSDRHATAPDPERASLVVAAEALIVQNNAINPLYEPIFASVSLSRSERATSEGSCHIGPMAYLTRSGE